ncbi:MAG TPA: D-glycerate dehydrogenase [Candidatus Nanoarchaeia archaeon]|nr:D-glycerate dehydrogenase [Candidatus Nanoarchaeia archaeon]
MAKIFVTRKIPEAGLKLLAKNNTLKIYPADKAIPRKDLLAGVKWCDALLCLLTDKIDSQVIKANPHLKIISNYAVGFNNIDVKSATAKGIPIANTPGPEIVDAVAEHTFALMLSISKRVVEGDHFIRRGKYKGWEPMLLLGQQIKGKILGIVGLGRIGAGVAERAGKGLGMNIWYYDVIRNKQFERKYKAKFVSLPTLLKQADIVTVHVPLIKETKHLIGIKEFSLMKKTAFLINTSRGPVVDEIALVKALKAKKLAGAALDVFEFEPKLAPGLIKLKNVILTPHTASATVEAREEMSVSAAKNILAVLRGMKPTNLVNPEIYDQK